MIDALTSVNFKNRLGGQLLLLGHSLDEHAMLLCSSRTSADRSKMSLVRGMEG